MKSITRITVISCNHACRVDVVGEGLTRGWRICNPTAALAEIVTLTQQRALTLIRFNGTTHSVVDVDISRAKAGGPNGVFDSRLR